MQIILASSSPRRKELLELIQLDFKIITKNTEEVLDDSLALPSRIEKVAYEKALPVAKELSESIDFVVIGADTIVEVDGKVLGKPKDKEDAEEMLNLLSGRKHSVITGVALIPTNNIDQPVMFHEITEVKFKKLTKEEISNYIATGESFDKAGSYAIQGIGTLMVEGIYGCYTNVVGLPVPLLTKKLAEHFNIRKI